MRGCAVFQFYFRIMKMFMKISEDDYEIELKLCTSSHG